MSAAQAASTTVAQHEHRQHLIRLKQMWDERAAGQRLKKGTVKYQRALLEFAIGYSCGLKAAGKQELNPLLLTMLSIGDPLDRFIPEQEVTA